LIALQNSLGHRAAVDRKTRRRDQGDIEAMGRAAAPAEDFLFRGDRTVGDSETEAMDMPVGIGCRRRRDRLGLAGDVVDRTVALIGSVLDDKGTKTLREGL